MIAAILTDIEGTTSSLSFVKDVLFPHAAARLPDFVRAHRDDPEVSRILADARALAPDAADDEALIARLLEWIAADRKLTPLKALQGLIWEEGYRKGHFSGHVYADAARWLRAWHDAGIALHVYSSGSVQAQRLLFAHSEQGDLTPLFTGFFDTRIGGKREPESYAAILREIDQPAERVLFLSDVREELDAARQVGIRCIGLAREEQPQPFTDHPTARDFDEVDALMAGW